ncbi:MULTISPECIES: hypothetical protein [Sphingobacterium]|uniref:hypothetical protein n=1 Tax=Sphingobacterium TaxID=28453 RepID=UPI00257D085A|nr:MULTISPECIES: hypothetical protein [Sphingobacterium]
MENHKQLIELQNQIEQLKNHLISISHMLSQSNKQIADIHKALFNNVAITREERKEQIKEYMKACLIMGNVAKQNKRKQ